MLYYIFSIILSYYFRAGPSGLLFQGSGIDPATNHPRRSHAVPVKPSRPAPVKITVGAYGENLTTIERKEVNTCTVCITFEGESFHKFRGFKVIGEN